MTFKEIVDQVLAMLQRRGRVTSRALKWQFTPIRFCNITSPKRV